MRPGVPWSVKGIDDQARKAAKSAARDAGLTLGQWLNSIILETAESGSGHTGVAAKKASQRKSTRGASADQPNETEIKKRLDQLAILNTGRASRLAGAAVQAQIEMASHFVVAIQPAIGDRSHQIDSTTRTIVLVPKLDIRRTGCGAKSTMDAIQKQVVVNTRARICFRIGVGGCLVHG